MAIQHEKIDKQNMVSRSPHRLTHPIFIALILLLSASALRLPSLTLNSFWADELFSASLTSVTFKEVLSITFNDVHPPLFNISIYLWSLTFGNSEFTLRLLTALYGIIGVPLSFLVFRKPFGDLTALAISILILFLPGHIYYSQEFRSYSLSFLLATLLTGLLFRYLDKPIASLRWGLALTSAALFATHYVSIFYIATILLIAATGVDSTWREKWNRISGLSLITFILISPFLMHMIYRRINMKSYWPSPVSLNSLERTLLHLFRNEVLLALIYCVLIAMSIGFAFYVKEKGLSINIQRLCALSLLPLSGVVAVSLITSNVTILIPRIILVFAPAIIVLAAVGLTTIPNKAFVVAALLIFSAVSGLWMYSSSFYTAATKSDCRGVAREIAKIENEYGKVLLVSLNKPWETNARHRYYLKMFDVNSKIINLPLNKNPNELVRYVETKTINEKTDKIVIFSYHKHIFTGLIERCNQQYRKIRAKTFAERKISAFVICYSLKQR